jgi:hypothetical protein
MNEDLAPAGQSAGQKPNQDTRKSKFSTTTKNNHSRLPLGKNLVMILEQIADKWARQGLYSTPSRAMYVLLGGVE